LAQEAASLTFGAARQQEQAELASSWRRLNRAATLVAVLTSPAVYLTLYRQDNFRWWTSLILTILFVAAFRGLVDVITRRMIPWPSLFGAEQKMLAEDVVARRRSWYWKRKYRLLWAFLIVSVVLWALAGIFSGAVSFPFGGWSWALDPLLNNPAFSGAQLVILLVQLPLLLVSNMLILFGPMLWMAIRGIKSYEPGDADWGVRLEHVRGQAEAKREITRIIDLWQAGDEFEKAGGKRERGMLFLGPPGTGKTMLAKAIATGFNSPFVTIAGSGFAQMFIGMDVIVVQYMAWKARRLAAKWGGTCIVFIDEIDAVGMRRSALAGQAAGMTTGMTTGNASMHDYCYHGRSGSMSSTCGLVLETSRWRERQFAERDRRIERDSWIQRLIARQAIPGGGMFGGGGGALNALLVVMDGMDDPPAMRRFVTNRFNTLMDALYLVPQRVGRISLRLPRPRPTGNQVYFIGACNTPIEVLDPALTRPGRMGRHIRFRTPIKDDRLDIFDYYLAKVTHDPELDTPQRREELARITGGYSPAMIEQACSTALTYSHHDGRAFFGRDDIVEAMTTIEAGMAIDVKYVETETRAVALHEAGHAAASHVYSKGTESTRLSIKMRGGSLGHHQAIEKEERFSSFRSELFARLVWIMGAIATEQVFYRENSNGVTGDMNSATTLAALMVGAYAMGPERIDFGDRFHTKSDEDEARKKIMSRFEDLGETLLAQASLHDDLGRALGSPAKRRAAAQLLGQAYFTAEVFISQNRRRIERIADTLIDRRELFGDDVVELLDGVGLQPAKLNFLEEREWPRL
jgi:SpoVK/Ycf46/Vps4 family AAA+-type ATPase